MSYRFTSVSDVYANDSTLDDLSSLMDVDYDDEEEGKVGCFVCSNCKRASPPGPGDLLLSTETTTGHLRSAVPPVNVTFLIFLEDGATDTTKSSPTSEENSRSLSR
jgi:hypothetical protein